MYVRDSASAATGSNSGLAVRSTWGSDSIVFQNSAANSDSLTMTITFGSYANNEFTLNQSVQAVGFTSCNAVVDTSYVVTFCDAHGAALSTQTASGSNLDNADGQTGGSVGRADIKHPL